MWNGHKARYTEYKTNKGEVCGNTISIEKNENRNYINKESTLFHKNRTVYSHTINEIKEKLETRLYDLRTTTFYDKKGRLLMKSTNKSTDSIVTMYRQYYTKKGELEKEKIPVDITVL